jgi:hypothetical protein
MPVRTMSNRDSGNVSIPALFAAWMTGGRMPSAASPATASWNRSSCSRVCAAFAEMALERWVQRPSSSRLCLDWISRAISAARWGDAPSRPMPVSILR